MINHLADSPVVFDTPKAKGRHLAGSEKLDFIHLTIEPGGLIPDHSLDVPVRFFIICGEGSVTVDGELTLVAEADFLQVDPGAMRSWQNTGPEVLRVLVIKDK